MRLKTRLACLAAALLTLGLSGSVSAQLATRPAEEWIRTLETPARIASLKINETLARLKLKPGDIVADIGAGTGVFSLPLAQAVKPGRAYAVDIDEALLAHISDKAGEQGMMNLKTVYGDFADPLLPEPVDVALINDVLHHIEKREEYLKALAGYMKPTGRIAIIEFIPAQGGHRDQPELQISKQTATGWLAAVGFKPVEDIPLFDDKWFVIYAKQ